VPLGSADKAFGIIAVQRKLLTKETCAEQEKLLESKLQGGSSGTLAEQLVTAGLVESREAAEVERIRSKHGRECEGCAKTTFLLPGESAQTKPCEHCGGKLKAGAPAAPAPPGPAPRPASPGPVARPPRTGGLEVARPTGKIDRTRAGAFSEEPAKPRSSMEDQLAEAERNERARKLRMAGSFGYEPPPPAAPAPAPPVEASPPPELPVEGVEGGSEAPLASPRIAGVVGMAASTARLAGERLGPLKDEAVAIFKFPLQGSGPAMLGIMAVLVGVAYAFSFEFVGFRWAPLLAPLVIYFRAYQVKLIHETTTGKDEPPAWPDWEETAWLGLRLFCCNVAVALPTILLIIFVTSVLGAKPQAGEVLSVGPSAHEMSSGKSPIQGKNAATTQLYDVEDNPVTLGERKGRYLVMGLIEKDDTDDTGIMKMARAMPKVGIGVAYFPGNQIYDLDRLARAVPDLDVAAVFIDPRWKNLIERGLKDRKSIPAGQRPPESSFGGMDAPSSEDEEVLGVGRSKPLDVNNLPVPGNQPRPARNQGPGTIGSDGAASESGRRAQTRVYEKLKVWRTRDLLMPEPFTDKMPMVPTVWIVDPSGKVARVFDGGASDRAIYGSVLDLQRGGDGDADPANLPGMHAGGGSILLEIVLYLGLAFAVVYGPMAILMTVVFTNAFIGFNYPAVVSSIMRAGKDYAFLMAVGAGTFAVMKLCDVTFDMAAARFLHGHGIIRHSLVRFLVAFPAVYGAVVEARAIGRFYVRAEGALGWFTPTAPPPAVNDASAWRPAALDGPSVPVPMAPRFQPGKGLRVLNAFREIPRGVSLAIAAAGLVTGCIALTYEMQHQRLDQAIGIEIGKAQKMRIDVKGDLVNELGKMGFAVAPEEIQAAVVEQPVGSDGSYVLLAYITVRSDKAGFYHQSATLTRGVGGSGFDYLDDKSSLWPAPRGRETFRHLCIGVGFLLLLVFGLKGVSSSFLVGAS